MKILVALNNSIIKEIIDKEFKGNVYKYDIDLKESVIEFLSNTEEDYVVITRDNLNGNIDNKLYIKQMRLANSKIKIIYLVKELTSSYKEFLFANEVFNIFEGEKVNIEEIIKCIKEEKNIVYKVDNKFSLNEAAVKYVTKANVLSKEMIAIYGTSGSGKSIISSILAKKISKDFDIKIALLDMDIQNPSLDIINNIDEKNASLSQIVESVDNSKEINNIIDKYMIKDSKNKNLWYITNNCSLFDCQNKLSNKYYEKLYASIYNKCDMAFIDLPTSPFLDVVQYTLNIATKIFFVINANYMSIRQAMKYIDLITKLWDIDNSNIYIIVNKMQKDSLDLKQIKSLLYGYKIITVFDYYKEIEGYINGGILDLDINVNLSTLYKTLGLFDTNSKGKLLKLIEKIGMKDVN